MQSKRKPCWSGKKRHYWTSEASYYYTGSLSAFTEDLKGCKASDFSEAKEKKDYDGGIVFYKLASLPMAVLQSAA